MRIGRRRFFNYLGGLPEESAFMRKILGPIRENEEASQEAIKGFHERNSLDSF